MAEEIRVSTGALAETIGLYLKLLQDASKVEVQLPGGGRRDLEDEKRQAILRALTEASGTLQDGCPEGVYGLFLTK
jgi:hypothetical protein